MKYFIDFEATQFSQEIISVGCVREDGSTFYSLVAPSNFSQVTNFITGLTGITKQMLYEALNADKVFEDLYKWIADDKGIPEFYCYGSADANFIRHTYDKMNDLLGRMMLRYIGTNLISYEKVLQRRMQWANTPSLLSVAQHFDSNVTQTHNALDDAILLKTVYDHTKETSSAELEQIFFDYAKKQEKKLKNKIVNSILIPCKDLAVEDLEVGVIYLGNKKGKVSYFFQNIEEATEWFLAKHRTPKESLPRIARRIERAIKSKEVYDGYVWRVKE